MLEFRNITRSFGDRVVLDKVSFNINKGETFVIVGPSGTGKSVSLRIMIGLLTPDSGQVLLNGQDLTAMDTDQRSGMNSHFGVLFQSGALLAWLTVAQNVALPLLERGVDEDEAEARTMEALRMVKLEHAFDRKPSEISGGMQKRAGLARAIVTRPDVILYDEPTSGLDPVMSRHIDALIKELQQRLGVTSVVVTHDLHSAFSIGDRIAMLSEGHVIAMGTPEEFCASDSDIVQGFIKAQFSAGYIRGIKI